MNYDDYLANRVDHQTFYCAVADAIGRGTLETIIRQRVATVSRLREALATDPHLNNIPLAAWDACDPAVRNIVAERARIVMPISWSARSPLKPGTYCWSLGETVCVLKAVARRMVEEAPAEGGEA